MGKGGGEIEKGDERWGRMRESRERWGWRSSDIMCMGCMLIAFWFFFYYFLYFSPLSLYSVMREQVVETDLLVENRGGGWRMGKAGELQGWMRESRGGS